MNSFCAAVLAVSLVMSPLWAADPARLEKHVRYLSETLMPRDHEHTANLDKAASYIRSEFQASGARLVEQTFQANGKTYRNVIASFGPEAGERLVIGAHYDACGPFPAADDNASGVAALLELAKALGQSPPRDRTDLVAWTLEEPPYFGTDDMGSAVHANRLAKEGVRVRGAVSLEMVGYFTDQKKSQRYPLPGLGLLYPSRGNFIVVAGRWKDRKLAGQIKRAIAHKTDLPVEKFVGPSWTPSLDWSDHRNYWKQGWPAVIITDTSYLRNPHYHQSTDTPDTLDYARMAEVVDGVFAFVCGK